MIVDAVFEGGGVKGLAFLGAIEQLEYAGYQWQNLAGTSAGSIVATLLAAGFSASEITTALIRFPFRELERKTGVNRIPFFGPWISLFHYNGIFDPIILEQWLSIALMKKGKSTFGDLPPNKLKIIVTDLTKNRMVVLPDDLPRYGIDPQGFPLSLAVRMSCSIPFLFRPVYLKGSMMVDGGVLSNYPVWVFDTDGIPRWPTFGFRLSGPEFVPQPKNLRGPLDMTLALIRTMLEGHDKRYVDAHSAERTIFIKGIKVGTIQFNLSDEEKNQLIELGREAARNFLAKWSFQSYIQQYRSPRQKSVELKAKEL